MWFLLGHLLAAPKNSNYLKPLDNLSHNVIEYLKLEGTHK